MRFVAPFLSTRCIGCYIGKAGYKDSSYLSGASSEPVISQPEIVGPIAVDESCRFLVLMSGGLCKTLRDIYSNETSIVNREIVQMIVEQVSHTAHFPLDNWIGMYNYLCHLNFFFFLSGKQFRTQSTLSGVSQSAIHKIVQLHHDTYMRQVEEAAFQSREDITLLVRNFNFPMPNAIQTQKNRNNVRRNQRKQNQINPAKCIH